MNLIYFANVDFHDTKSLGVIKKIYGQINAFTKSQYKIDLCYTYKNNHVVQNINNNKISIFKKISNNSLINTLKGKSSFSRFLKHIDLNNYDIAYIRFVSLDIGTLLFLRRLRKNVKLTLLEIPTYPYMNEKYIKFNKRNIKERLKFYKIYLLDYALRFILRIYVNFIVLTIPKRKLWGIPVISIENGIDTERVKLRKIRKKTDKIILFTATNIEVWQGLDRLIYGIKEFKKYNSNDIDVIIKIAGKGSQKEKLDKLIDSYDLSKNIEFCGEVYGNRLDGFYEEADIAIGSLGRHRQNTNVVSTLKVKEYCAKGIPFIYSNDEPTLSGNEEFAFKVPADDSPVNFNDVIHFYRKNMQTHEPINKMRRIAKERYDWSHQIKIINKEVDDYLRDN